MKARDIRFGSSVIDSDTVYFIADIGANHNGSLQKAIELIHLAKEAGANAAKFQNFQAHKIVSNIGFENLEGQLAHQAKWEKSVYQVYQDASISQDWTPILKEECLKAGIDYFTSPYDFDSVDSVDPFVDIYKIGSGDITWLEIIKYIFEKGKPVIIATGASDLTDVQRVMNLSKEYSNQIILMQCNTNYTGSVENFKYCNLNVLNLYGSIYPDVQLGLSDHTSGHSAVLGAITLGARVIEKHFTDDNKQIGPDHGFAMNPITWREMVEHSYELLVALGDGIKRVEPNELSSLTVQRRSIRFIHDLKMGSTINKEDLMFLRPIPEDGLNPYEIDNVLGKVLKMDVKAGEHLSLKMLI